MQIKKQVEARPDFVMSHFGLFQSSSYDKDMEETGNDDGKAEKTRTLSPKMKPWLARFFGLK
ncbi:hypothetical protein [Pedobacter sp.]|uniref:hypothetical protein n=1 Tax=Pedobacter sp. TaxID=1411316 RepID=UPI003BA97497